VGGPPARRHDAPRWPLPPDDDEDDGDPSGPGPGADVVPVDDWELYLLELGAARREGLRAGARLVAFIGLGLAVAATGWINVKGFVKGFSAPGAPARPIDEALMWAFAVTGTLLVAVSLVLLAMAVVEARLRRRRIGG
jgi:hypothetical protein